MEVIKTHIKNDSYAPVYLLCGEEDYLKTLYRNKLKAGILGDGDEMNFSLFQGKGVDAASIRDVADTLPFFSSRRLIIIEDSGWFKSAGDFVDYLPSMPDTTHIVFVESEVDKRNRLYKYVVKSGVVAVMDRMDAKNMTLWIAGICQKNQRKIREKTIQFLLEHVDNDMNNLQNEMEKLLNYTEGREEITIEDIEAVCSMHISNQIFPMIDAVGAGRRDEVLRLYHDLLALREKPLSILYLVSRHFNILLQVKEQIQRNNPREHMAKKIGIPPFTVKKYVAQAEKFSQSQLIGALDKCLTADESVKTGRLDEQIAVELVLIELSSKIFA